VQAPQGTFPVRQIKIVEMVPQKTFGVNYCFQIGNDNEVMYLAAESLEKMDNWIEKFKNATKDSGNKMMVMYHTGVYNLHRRRAWSCCGEEQEKSEGCSPVGSLESCLITDSESPSELVGRDDQLQRERSNSEGSHPQPRPLMNHRSTKVMAPWDLPMKKKPPYKQDLPQSPKSPLKLSSSPSFRKLHLSDMIIPSSRIKLVETLGEVLGGLEWCTKLTCWRKEHHL